MKVVRAGTIVFTQDGELRINDWEFNAEGARFIDWPTTYREAARAALLYVASVNHIALEGASEPVTFDAERETNAALAKARG